MSLALGPFDLIEPVARGGMGTVWRGVHRTTDVPVAAKVVTPPTGREQAYHEQFVYEVQAMARLHHPAIVRLHEYGSIDEATALKSRGSLPAGAPFLVMEWLGGGSLRQYKGMNWPRLRATLLTVLDALAHAHAQGVVHRDLKPDNVLLGDRGPVLTDFGLAFNPAVVGSALESGSYGTPGYMAPEQIRNDWRAFGPWTDLYAVGCMAFELVCGYAPHADQHQGSAIGLLVAHLQDPLPALRPRFSVPAAFEQWVTRAMGRTPRTRFQFAADAAVALLAISDEVGAGDARKVRDTDLPLPTPFASTVDAPGELAVALVAEEERARVTRQRSIEQALADDATLDIRGPLPLFQLDGLLPPSPDEPVERSAPRTDGPGSLGPSSSGGPGDTAQHDIERYMTDLRAREIARGRDPAELFDASLDADVLLFPAPTGERDTLRPMAPRPLAADEEDEEDGEAGEAGEDGDDRSDITIDTTDRSIRLTSRPPTPRPAGAETLQLPPVFLPITDDTWALGPLEDGRPPMPGSWRRQREPEPPPMIDVGLTLARMRTPPAIGRSGERDHLWSALAATVEGRAQAVLIEGPSGQGKSHLAAWLARRAHELGIADQLVAVHDRLPSPTNGPMAMMVGALRTGGLVGAERIARVAAALGREPSDPVVTGLAAVLPTEPDDESSVPPALDDTELEWIAQGLAALCERRPLVIRCDDLQYGEDTLRLIEIVLALYRELPILFLGTVREDALADAAAARSALERLNGSLGVSRVRLGPLKPLQQFELIQSLIPLSPNLVDRLVERTGGSPQFAVELVRHWIATGALESSPAGFRLRVSDADLSLPGEQHTLWMARLESALRGAEERAISAIELAAALGQSVDGAEWKAVCQAAGIGRPRRAMTRLADARLIRTEGDSGWAFTNSMLRDALCQRARELGHWRRWNAICAKVLASQTPVDQTRLAEHLLAAEVYTEAISPLLGAIDVQLDREETVPAERLLRRLVRTMRLIGRSRYHPEWVAVGARWCRLCRQQGRLADALRHARRSVERGRLFAAQERHAEGLLALGETQLLLRGPSTAWSTFARVLTMAPTLDEPILGVRIRCAAGACLIEQGRYAAAERTLSGAIDALRSAEMHRLRGDVMRSIADLERRRGRLERAERYTVRAGRAYYKAGARPPLARAALVQGHIERARGRFDEAAARIRDAGRVLRTARAPDAPLAQIDLALLLIEMEQYREARSVLSDVITAADTAPIFRPRAAACLLPCVAHAGEWGEWRIYWPMVSALDDREVADPDLALVAERAAEQAAAVGAIPQADQARGFAIRQYERLGMSDRAAALRARRTR